jgi:RHS repeat-associated protein
VGGIATHYTLDLNNSLTQVLADGTDRYLYGMGRIAQQTPGGLQYFLPDALGSARQLTGAAGALALVQSFDPYGGLLSSQGSAATPYGFAGEWCDNASGLIYLRARYYLPQAGIFTARDTWIGDFTAPASLNHYIYARNNPLRYIDPSGHDVWDTIVEFSTGMVYEFAWASSWVSPQRPWTLAPSSCESVVRLAGRTVGDILAILVGLDWIGSGAGGISAGLTMCGTGVLCPAGVGVIAVSGVAVAAGGVLTVGGAVGLGQNLTVLFSKKNPNINKKIGDAYRDEIADRLKEAGYEVEKEVVKKTPFGSRRIDIEVSKDGRILGGIETKTGGSRYLPSQRAKDAWLLRFLDYIVNVVRKK